MTRIQTVVHAVVAAIWLAAALAPIPATAQNEPDPAYWRLANIRDKLVSWQALNPGIMSLRSIGDTGLGQPIDAVCISDNVNVAENEPCLIFNAAQHANECNGTTAIMSQIETLLVGYGSDADITARVDGLEMWFIPVMNPDGHDYVFGSGETSWADWRKTLRDNNKNEVVDYPDDGVDLNRNWDWYWDEYAETDIGSSKYKGPAAFSEPEAVALRSLLIAEQPVVLVDYHSPVTISWSNYIFYPWQSQHGMGHSPDFPVAGDVAGGWADATLTVTGGTFNSIWAYDSLPKQQCWAHGKMGILAFVMEISDHCWWSAAEVDTIGHRVARGSAYLLDRVLEGPGIRGVVTDVDTGLPLVAEVRLEEMYSEYIGPRLTEPEFGSYFRLTLNQTYTVSAHCEGYLSQTLSATVPDSGWVRVDFALAPYVSAVPDDDDSTTTAWLKFSNPLPRGQAISLAMPGGAAPATVELFDLRGHRIASLGESLPAASVHTLRLPGRLPAGVYLLRTRAGAEQQLRRVVLVR